MKFRVKKNFAGAVNGTAGRTVDIDNDAVASDLLQAGYIEPAEKKKKAVKKHDDQ